MTARELKTKTFSIIEEYYPEQASLADDEDVKNKINGVINSVITELSRYKPIRAKYTYEIKEEKEKVLLLKNIPDLYQLTSVKGSEYEKNGEMELEFNINDKELPFNVDIYYNKYPKLMSLEIEEDKIEEYDKEFEFDLDLDVLEIAPYGIAADLLKNDMISKYGEYFYKRYINMLNTINPNVGGGIAYISGGVDI